MSITVRNTKKEEFLNVVSVNEGTNEAVVDKSYFETSADQTIIDKPIAGVTGGNVAEALENLAEAISQAGKVDDVVGANGASIVTNKIANLSKAAVGLGNVDNTADADKRVAHATEAGTADSAKKLNKKLNFISKHGSIDNTCWFDGVVDMNLTLDEVDFQSTNMSQTNTRPTTLEVHLAESGVTAGTYNGITVDSKGRVTKAVDGDYATNTDVNGKLDKKLDKAGGTVTGALAVNGGVTIGGNLTVNGTTTTVNSTTLAVADKLIEVASKNTAKLTTPAGIVVPKYDGTNSGALVFDGDGIASVGDVVLNTNGDIDTTKSQLQTLATRTGLVDGKLVKYDGTNKTLVDTGKTVGDFATAAQGATADAAKAKADTNATDIANIKNGTTVVANATHANTADSATNVTTNINGKAITSIFETNGTTVKNATNASSADTANRTKAGLSFYVDGNTSSTPDYFFNGNKEARVYSSSDIAFVPYQYTNALQLRISDDFKVGTSRIEDGAVTDAKLATVSGLTAGVYTALQVNEKGRATAGQQAFAVIGPNDDIPSNVVIGGFILRAKA